MKKLIIPFNISFELLHFKLDSQLWEKFLGWTIGVVSHSARQYCRLYDLIRDKAILLVSIFNRSMVIEIFHYVQYVLNIAYRINQARKK
jgi:hypothetical protein